MIPAFYIIDIKEHKEIKSILLDLIQNSSSRVINKPDEEICVNDWYNDIDGERSYFEYVFPILKPYLDRIFNDIGYFKWEIDNMWFHQYEKEGMYTWHWHECTFYGLIYYVELPDGSPMTEFEIPYTKEIVVPDVKEGQLVIFPSIMKHRSPPNQIDGRKTVIVMNVK
jgi:hypothetical protein